MSFADVNYEDFQPSQQAQHDKNMLVKFEYRSVQDQAATAEQGRPIFKERLYIDMKIPGSREGIVKPARPADISRFQRHYEAFKARVELPTEGTPLSEWPGITRSRAEELAYINIKTVEQLASVNDSIAGNMMGGNTLKASAQKWLDRATDGVTADKLSVELADRDEQMRDMQAQLEDLKVQLAARPRKRKSRAKPKVLPVVGDPTLPDDGLPVEGDPALGVHPIIQAEHDITMTED
jgi:hypothetical protein